MADVEAVKGRMIDILCLRPRPFADVCVAQKPPVREVVCRKLPHDSSSKHWRVSGGGGTVARANEQGMTMLNETNRNVQVVPD